MELVFIEGVTLAQDLGVSGRKSRNPGTWSPALQFARWWGAGGGAEEQGPEGRADLPEFYIPEEGPTGCWAHNAHNNPGRLVLAILFLQMRKQKLEAIKKVPCPRTLCSKWWSDQMMRSAFLCLHRGKGPLADLETDAGGLSGRGRQSVPIQAFLQDLLSGAPGLSHCAGG